MSPFEVRGSGVADVAEFRLALGEAIRGLTPQQKRALRLWFVGYTQEEIGKILGIRQQSAWELLQNAFAALREELQELWPSISGMELSPTLVDVVLEATANDAD